MAGREKLGCRGSNPFDLRQHFGDGTGISTAGGSLIGFVIIVLNNKRILNIIVSRTMEM